jgi:hypothetical protein
MPSFYVVVTTLLLLSLGLLGFAGTFSSLRRRRRTRSAALIAMYTNEVPKARGAGRPTPRLELKMSRPARRVGEGTLQRMKAAVPATA